MGKGFAKLENARDCERKAIWIEFEVTLEMEYRSLGVLMERNGKLANMFVQAQTLWLLVKWEELVDPTELATAQEFDPSPKLHVVGTADIGKSGLAFIALVRCLAIGLKVCLFYEKAPARILALDDEGRLVFEDVPDLSELYLRGLDR